MTSPTLAPPDPPGPRQRGSLARLLHQHEQLEEFIAARRSHGLPVKEARLAMVRLEDRLADEYPLAFAHWITVWAQRRFAAHPRGQRSADCLLCQQTGGKLPQPLWKTSPNLATLTHHTHKAGAPLRR